MERFLNQRTFRWLGLIVACVGLVCHIAMYSFITDDAYISFVYARNLAEHGELTFNLGLIPVEGFTNFLWTVSLALWAKLGFSIEKVSLILGAAFSVATLVLVFRVSKSIFKGPSLWDVVAPLMLASTSGYACWASGGLETQMFVFWAIFALAAYVVSDHRPRLLRLTGLALAFAAMTRPEGLLVAGVIGVHRLLINILRDRRVIPHRYEWAAMIWFACVFGPYFIWRYVYFGHVFPNTYYVKAAGEASQNYMDVMQQNGLYYVSQWANDGKLWFIAPLACCSLIAKIRSARFVWATVSLLLVVAYVLYAIRVGGDFMGLYRFVMLPWVLLNVSAVFGLRSLYRASRQRFLRRGLLGATVVLMTMYAFSQIALTQKQRPSWKKCQGNKACLTHHQTQIWPSNKGIDSPSYLSVYAHDRKIIGEKMAPCFKTDDFAVFGGVGAKPYFSGLEGVDVFGLVSEKIAHLIPRTRPRAGHNKWGPDSKMFEWYEPEFIFQCYSIHSMPTNAKLNCRGNFWERNNYEKVTMHIPGLIERGEYYTFFVRSDRGESFKQSCLGVLP